MGSTSKAARRSSGKAAAFGTRSTIIGMVRILDERGDML